MGALYQTKILTGKQFQLVRRYAEMRNHGWIDPLLRYEEKMGHSVNSCQLTTKLDGRRMRFAPDGTVIFVPASGRVQIHFYPDGAIEGSVGIFIFEDSTQAKCVLQAVIYPSKFTITVLTEIISDVQLRDLQRTLHLFTSSRDVSRFMKAAKRFRRNEGWPDTITLGYSRVDAQLEVEGETNAQV